MFPIFLISYSVFQTIYILQYKFYLPSILSMGLAVLVVWERLEWGHGWSLWFFYRSVTDFIHKY